jgi:transcriptional regulator with XRE-family HTH domain
LGAFIRSQRKLANLSLRQLAELHQPSVRVLKLLSNALDVSAETLLAEAGLLDPDHSPAGAAKAASADSVPSLPDAAAAIRADQRLSDDQKAALIAVYQSMLRPT